MYRQLLSEIETIIDILKNNVFYATSVAVEVLACTLIIFIMSSILLIRVPPNMAERQSEDF